MSLSQGTVIVFLFLYNTQFVVKFSNIQIKQQVWKPISPGQRLVAGHQGWHGDLLLTLQGPVLCRPPNGTHSARVRATEQSTRADASNISRRFSPPPIAPFSPPPTNKLCLRKTQDTPISYTTDSAQGNCSQWQMRKTQTSKWQPRVPWSYQSNNKYSTKHADLKPVENRIQEIDLL